MLRDRRPAQVGDMLVSVNGTEVQTLEAARAMLLGAKGSRVVLQLCRSSVAPADGRVEYIRFDLSLARGDAKFFLTLDTKRFRVESQVANALRDRARLSALGPSC